MTKKELEMVVASQAAEIQTLRELLVRAGEEYNNLGELDGMNRESLQTARRFAKVVGNLLLVANRAAYAGDCKAARKATWEALGLFPKGHEKAKALEAARKAASGATTATKKEEVDTSDLV